MDLNFEWRTREEKLLVVAYWWDQQEGKCCICHELMKPYHRDHTNDPDRATVEHLIPRRDGGPNTAGNIRLAHAVCNHALGALWGLNEERRIAGLPPMSERWAITNARGRLKVSMKAERPAMEPLPVFNERSWFPRESLYYKRWIAWKAEQEERACGRPGKGTLAYAVMIGEVSANLTYRKAPKDLPKR